MDAQEAVSEDPAFQEEPELSLDEARQRAIAVAGTGEKRLELFRDDLVKDSSVCPAGSVGWRGDASAVAEARRDCTKRTC